MSLLDKLAGAVTPPESDEKRREARAKAQSMASADDWLGIILDHHARIEAQFNAVKLMRDMGDRLAALKQLALILTGHSNAEESVIYPALVRFGHKSHGMAGYAEQAGAKANMAELEYLDPMSEEFTDKLEHIRGAVLHHMFEEESDRFLDLKELSSADQQHLTRRFKEEFDRYIQGDEAQAQTRNQTHTSPGVGSGSAAATPH